MRVLHVTPYFEAAWAYGGIPRVATLLARALAARGHRVTVATTDAAEADARAAYPPRLAGVEVRCFPNLSNRLAYRLQWFQPLGFERWIGREISGFDVVHVHGLRHLPGARAARRAAERGVPLVLQPNGTAPRIERRRWAKRIFDGTVGRGTLESAGCLLAVTAAEAAGLLRLGVPAARLRRVANPVELASCDGWAARAMRDRLGVGREAPLVVFLGRITPRKRAPLVVAAFAALGRPQARLVLAGNDGGGLRAALRAARELGVAGRMLVPGLLRGEERFALLAAADVVVYPGTDEAFGLVALEAAGMGTPVVVAAGTGCGELVATTGAGLAVRGDDPRDFAAAMASLIGRRVPQARERIEAHFAPARIAAEVEAVYRELAP